MTATITKEDIMRAHDALIAAYWYCNAADKALRAAKKSRIHFLEEFRAAMPDITLISKLEAAARVFPKGEQEK